MRLAPSLGSGVLGDFDGMDWVRDWVGLDRGLCGRLFWGRFLGLSFPWGHGVSPSLFSFFIFVIGGSGVLSHGAVFGLFLLFLFYFLFFMNIGTLSEHTT